ncbi:hypothetical protein M407DRAFT_27020 [Tulasnella calospora MUT 4182]|uniref:Fungal pheromone STE3G-protein-coupled receptor n=1 Tax=Tulasnella calospora MUT 4182 TaxID=1051891 RepID=A0A0C3LPZ9_9AGAM|nr:hypothetical protein M407DRAFT_27020 [Tulasnella calospora MUT 4182]
MSSFITTNSFDPTYPIFPVLASIGIVLILLPSYWHFKSGNVGTMLYIVWTFIGNLNYLVNSISWKGNLHNPPWLWCDLSTALIIALNVALPTSSLLITRRLYSISTIRQVNILKSDSRRTKYFEFALGIGLPALAVISHVVVQGHRFDIFENIGCWPALYVTPVTIPMVFLPPILINMVSTVYASLAIRAFLKQRKEFSDVLASSGSDIDMTINRYFRLMALAATEIICALPTSTYMLVTNIQNGLFRWISWADTHYNFNRVGFMPLAWFNAHPKGWILINLSRYMLPVGSFLFFVYLGMFGDCRKFYRKQFWRLAGVLGFSTPSETLLGSWSNQPLTGAPSQPQTLPAFATAVPVTLTAKETSSSMDSPSRPVSVPPDSNGEMGSGAESIFPSRASLEVHPSVV